MQETNKDFPSSLRAHYQMVCNKYRVQKYNVDAGFFEVWRKTGFGMCLHDHMGHFVQARTEWTSPKLCTHEDEALGLLQAICWVIEIGVDSVIFETDSKQVVDEVTKDRVNLTKFGSIMAQCKELFSYFPNF